MKSCITCSELKDYDEFFKDSRYTSGYRNECKACYVPRLVMGRLDRHLRKTYGISTQQYNELVKRQNGLCAICEQPETVRPRRGKYTDTPMRLAVDHDHVTGRVRGLLCKRCNIAMGHFRDDPLVLARAIEYLMKVTDE